jgi:Uma2 family endonuclease
MADMLRIRMTSEEFYRQAETSRIEELIDGELVVTPPPLDIHQDISSRLYLLLAKLVGGGTLRYAPTGVHFDEGQGYEPDIFWISPENTTCALVDGRYWHCAPDLIIETLSPSTAERDRGVKFDTYEKHGVREYWLADPESQFVEVYTLTAGRFSRLGLFGKGKSFPPPVLNNASIQIDTFFS